MKSKLPYILLFALVLAVCGACNNGGCYDNRSAIPKAAFYSATTGNAISLNTLTIRGADAPNDSILLGAGSAATEVYLPMRSTQNTTEWILEYSSADENVVIPSDHVTFVYSSQPYFASSECGAFFNYHIERVEYSRNVLDSVAIIAPDSLITNLDVTSLQFYFRTTESPDEDE